MNDTSWKDEFALIDRLLDQSSISKKDPSAIMIPPGDDAALLKPVEKPVITTDTQKEDVHFRRDWQTPEEIGYKAVSVTFSDLAASYAVPVCLFINLALPSDISENYVESIYTGVNKALLSYNCELGGGNISGGNQLSLDLFAIGRGHDTYFPLRSEAQPGEMLCSTGALGMARAGMDCLDRKDMVFTKLIETFKNPVARFDAAEVLAGNHVKCVMDISDGLSGDAGHIAGASGISIALEPDPADVDGALISYCKKYGFDPVEMVLAGGEDYELLFSCSDETFKSVKKDMPGCIVVGKCLPYDKKSLVNLPSHVSSFQHGKYI